MRYIRVFEWKDNRPLTRKTLTSVREKFELKRTRHPKYHGLPKSTKTTNPSSNLRLTAWIVLVYILLFYDYVSGSVVFVVCIPFKIKS